MNTLRPGFNPTRMVHLIQAAIDRCCLDMSDLVVLTEAATGAYVVTPVIAALAGAAKVYAVAKSSRYGSKVEVVRQTYALAKQAGVYGRIKIVDRPSKEIVGLADIVTNSGHVRPLNSQKIGWMKPTAVIPLMYEAWEYREEDINLDACRHKGVRVVGTNEQNPEIDVFGYLGELAMKQLMDAGISVYKSKILLLSDNDFCMYISRALSRGGASVDIRDGPAKFNDAMDYDAIILAMRPRPGFCLAAKDIREIDRRWPGALLVQFFGDMDRIACRRVGLQIWPEKAPAIGHMGILPAAIGPESTIRLQTGGLKAAEAVRSNSARLMNKYAQIMKRQRYLSDFERKTNIFD